VAYSLDGLRIATAGWDMTVRVWEAATGREILVLRGHTSRVWSVTFSPDGSRIASSAYETKKPGEVKVWDAVTGQETLTLKEPTGGVMSVAFSPDGQRIASGGDDGTVKIWDARPLQEEPAKPGSNPR
jgi:WD40 repeat protein